MRDSGGASCAITVWDGPYAMRCGYTIVNGRCIRHGPVRDPDYHRPEDRNARQARATFEDGATLAELEEFVAEMRRRGAPDDAHPEVSTNPWHEITGIVCVTERAAASTAREPGSGTREAGPSPADPQQPQSARGV